MKLIGKKLPRGLNEMRDVLYDISKKAVFRNNKILYTNNGVLKLAKLNVEDYIVKDIEITEEISQGDIKQVLIFCG